MFINEIKVKTGLFFNKIKLIIGIFISVIFIPATIAALLGNSDLKDYTVIYLIFSLPGILLIYSSLKSSKRIKAAKLYQSIFSQNLTGEIELFELAKMVRKKEEETTEEINTLIQNDLLRNVTMELSLKPRVILNNSKIAKEDQYEVVQCPNCGASVRKRIGYISKCEYCDTELI